MPSSKPTTPDAINIFLKVYGESNSNSLQKNNQMLAERDQLNQKKAESERFFALMMDVIAQNRASALLSALRAQLLDAAKDLGFANLPDAMNLAQNKNNQSPLEHAFLQQDFNLAKIYLNLGAEVSSRERAAFELALGSKAASDFGFTSELSQGKNQHVVKDYGLVLGIQMTSADGTNSQYAHIAPTYQIMADSVRDYTAQNPDNHHFEEISEAFDFSNNAAAFSYSRSERNPKAGEELVERIQSGKVTTIPIGCKGHFMGLAIVPDGPNSGYLVYTNRGVGSRSGEAGTQIFRMEDLSKVNPKFINSVMNGLADGASHDAVLRQIQQVTGGKPPIHTIEQKSQKHDNCSIANPRSNIEGIRLCQEAVAKGGFNNLKETDFAAVKAEYKDYTGHMRAQKVNELAKALTKNPNDADLKNLAKEYLKQHARSAPHLKQPLEKALGLESSQDVSYQSSPRMR